MKHDKTATNADINECLNRHRGLRSDHSSIMNISFVLSDPVLS